MPKKGFVTLTAREYKRLLDQEKLLIALEVAGVENWEGYDHARGQWLRETFPATVSKGDKNDI